MPLFDTCVIELSTALLISFIHLFIDSFCPKADVHLRICLRTNAVRSSCLQISKKKKFFSGVMKNEVMKKETQND